jgi:flagellar motor switch protein FliM
MDGARAKLLVMVSPVLLGSILPAGTAGPNEALERRLAAAAEQTLEVEQVLGHAQVSLADLARLRIGDVIVLEEPLSKGGDLQLAGSPIGSTRPGRVGQRRAVQLHMILGKGRSG